LHTRRNQFDQRDSLEIGDKAESIFARIAENRGWRVSEASKRENINEHWDFLIEKLEESYKVDVKAMKRISRYDSAVQDTWLWVELHGVRNYDRGWLYDGKADLIAVENVKSFVIIKRINLIELVERLVDRNSVVSVAKEAKYKVYSRHSRPDRISMIETEKLESIKWAEWRKI